MTATNVPDVGDTDLTRDEMEEIAEEYGIDADGLDDQQLLERLGVALGEIEESEIGSRDGERGADDGDEQSDGGLREVVATKLQGAADKLRTDTEEPPGGGDGAAADASEQDQPGEPIEGPTRNELRDELRELGLPLSGTKAELQERLDEARGDQDGRDDGDGNAGDEDASQDRMDWLRQKVSKRLASTADRVSRESGSDDHDGAAGQGEDQEAAGAEQDRDGGHSQGLRDRLGRQLVHLGERLTRDDPDEEDGDDGDSGGSSKMKLAGKAVWRKITPG